MKFGYRLASTLCLLPVLAGLSACATNGVMYGRMDGQAIQLHYHHGFWNQNGTAPLNLPTLNRDATPTAPACRSGVTRRDIPSGLGFGLGSGGIGVFTGGGNTSRATAVLMGSEGDSMHCIFQLAHPGDDLEGGGVGYCKLSTGQVYQRDVQIGR
ncbi:MAG: hypothetical protein ACRESR_02300 [Gammaproteobacteria bacterium]